MRRTLLLLALAAAGAAAPLRAQEEARVRLEVSLTPDSSGRTEHARLVTRDVVRDPRVTAMLASGFPVRLHYKVEVWRSRSLLDAFVRQTEWDVVIRHEPLLDQYQVGEVFRFTNRISRFADLRALAEGLAVPREVRVGPRDPGEYYYAVTLEVSTLSDTDIADLEQFLSGEVAPATTGSEPIGGAITKAIRRTLLSVAGLPSLRLEARSPKFVVR